MQTKFDLKIHDIATKTAFKLYDVINLIGIESYYIAGGCFQKTVHDYDLFPVNENDFNNIDEALKDYIVFKSKNAITINYNNIIIQFCKYHHNSLVELVDSFDFAHCQIGAKIEHKTHVVETYYSNDYVDWKMTDVDVYVGSEYPLSSLIRSFKYKENFLGKHYKKQVVKILIDIIKRGFKDYDDFKNQLDAIDLMYIDESDELIQLFELLKK